MKTDPNSISLRVNGSRIANGPSDPLYRIRGLE
jgi:hypothetical protein